MERNKQTKKQTNKRTNERASKVTEEFTVAQLWAKTTMDAILFNSYNNKRLQDKILSVCSFIRLFN